MTRTSSRAIVACAVALIFSAINSPPLFAVIPFIDGFDGDGDVDNFDLTRLLGNYGITVGGNSLNGDTNGDGDVDGGDYFTARANFSFSGAVGASGSAGTPTPVVNPARLYYNPANGALLLEGAFMTSFILQSTGAFNTINPANFPFGDDPDFSKNLAMRTTSVFAQADPLAANLLPLGLLSNPHNLGNLLPPGLTHAGLQALSLRGVYSSFVTNPYPGQLGQGLHSLQLVVLPEPAASTLTISLAASLFAARRRRRGTPGT